MNNLHPIAQAVQSQGRGNDTQLVHMTPGEVQGLQALAMAHGGSLSINPETGLPEAGFLESMLPTILGIGLAAATGGTSLALTPGMIGLGIGGLQYARTGSLEKGLMAGLGAYGGAGMAGSLGLGAAGAAGGVGSGVTAAPAVNPSIQAADIGARTVVTPDFSLASGSGGGMGLKAVPSSSLTSTSPLAAAPPPTLTPMPVAAGPVQASPYALSNQPTVMDKLGSGQFWKDNWKSAAAAAAPTAMDMMTPEGTTAPADNEQFQYTYDPGRASEEDLDAQRAAYAARGITGGELKFFRPKYGPRQTVQVAQGGEIGYADGGTIDLSGTFNLGGQGARGGASAGMPNNSFTPMPGGLMGGLGALAFPDEIPRSSLVREHGGVSGNPMMLSNAQYDGRPIKKQTYEEYLAGRSPLQQDVQLTREQFENPSPYTSPGVMFAKGGEIGYADGGTSDYEYDPVSQTYKKVVQAPTGAVDPIGINGSGRTGDSSNDNQPLSQQTIDFLDKEEDTPGARDARMGEINDFVTQIGKMSIVGAIARGLMGLGDKSEAAPAGATPTGAKSDQPGQVSGGPASDDGSGPGNMGEGYGDGFGFGMGYANGGIAGLAAGGMSKGGFVVPADVVSALGNGSSDAGLRKLYALIGDVKPIKGKGDGLSDSIPTSIDGRQPARVADGEAYVNPKTVAKIGGGDAKKGAKKLYAMMDKIRQQAHGNKTQQRKVDPRKVV
jgi:hypothetical protein